MNIEIPETNQPEQLPKNVIGISPGITNELEITLKQNEVYRECSLWHKNVVVDSKSRTLVCEDCKCTIDPFVYVERWAKEGWRLMQGLSALKLKIKIANKEFGILEKKLDSVRGKLKRSGEPESVDDFNKYKIAMWNPETKGREFLIENAS